MRTPEPLTSGHNVAEFYCSDTGLNEWLKKKALKNHSTGISRVYVICAENTNQVIGYYCLSTGSIQRNTAPGAYRRNAPDSLPVIVLGRLAIDQAYLGKGLGVALLKDAIYRTENIARQVRFGSLKWESTSFRAWRMSTRMLSPALFLSTPGQSSDNLIRVFCTGKVERYV